MEGIFNNRLLFENNMLLFSVNFCGGQGLDGGGQSRDGGIPPVPSLGKTLCAVSNIWLSTAISFPN